MKLFLRIIFFSLFSQALLAQSNCNNHVIVPICPTSLIQNETTSGMGDDAPANINIAGEDVLYEITAPNGATKIFVSTSNSTGPLKISLGLNCNSGSYSSGWFYSASSTRTYYVTYSNTYYVWVDAAAAVNYDISFGADTGVVLVSIPNTQGNLGLETTVCAAPSFQPTKPFLHITYNTIVQTFPMTLSPLNVQGSLCVSTFFKNTTGVEGVNRFEFEFDPTGFSTFTTSSSIAGMFVPGSWVSSRVGNKIIFRFFDAAGTGQGDFSGTPNTCLNYHFCFDVLPITNDPVKTNVKVTIFSDGNGAGFSGYLHRGCCPSTYSNCLGYTVGPGGSGGHGFGFTFNDPGNPLPIKLTDFNAHAEKNHVKLNWTTASEINNDYFTIERSKDGNEWMWVNQIDGAGNSTITNHYETMDEHPYTGISYYRLKQTDFDGAFTYSEIISTKLKDMDLLNIYPNPASSSLTIEGNELSSLMLDIYDLMNKKMVIPMSVNSNQCSLNISQLPAGIYFLVVERDGLLVEKKKIIIQR